MEDQLRMIGKFVARLASNVFKHDIATLSAQICFYAIFSLFPLVILVIYGTTLLIPHAQIQDLILNGIKPYYPAITDATDFIRQTIEGLGTVGARVSLVSFLTLIWSASSAFIAIQQAMDTIFEIQDGRSFVSRRVVAFAMLILLILVSVLSSVALYLYPIMANKVSFWHGIESWAPGFHRLTRILYPLSLFVTCCIAFRYLPSRRVNVNSVIIGAITATVALDLARTLFVVYAAHLVSYHLIYGGLAVVMLLVLWMYIAGILLLFGAEITAALDKLGNEESL